MWGAPRLARRHANLTHPLIHPPLPTHLLAQPPTDALIHLSTSAPTYSPTPPTPPNPLNHLPTHLCTHSSVHPPVHLLIHSPTCPPSDSYSPLIHPSTHLVSLILVTCIPTYLSTNLTSITHSLHQPTYPHLLPNQPRPIFPRTHPTHHRTQARTQAASGVLRALTSLV